MTKEELFNENIGIAYKIASKYLTNYQEEFDDIKQIALEGLWYCCMHYDYKHSLTTFAYTVIPNRINCYLRSLKNYRKRVNSLYENISYNDDGEAIQRIETIEGPNYIDDLLDSLEIDELNNIIDKLKIPKRTRDVFSSIMNGETQINVAKKYNYSQSYVSRIRIQVAKKIKEVYDTNGRSRRCYI